MIRITVTSVLVDDQAKALKFYTEVLGFVKKTDLPLGDARWLTVVSPSAPDGVELPLEPDAHPAAKAFKKAIFAVPEEAMISMACSASAKAALPRGFDYFYKSCSLTQCQKNPA